MGTVDGWLPTHRAASLRDEWGTRGLWAHGRKKALEFVVMIQVWQVGIINTQGFEKYFLLMEQELGEFSTGEGLTCQWGDIGGGSPTSVIVL